LYLTGWPMASAHASEAEGGGMMGVAVQATVVSASPVISGPFRSRT
jgi:hypothetical protein